jgi:excisionase family DNA binding protein
MLNPAALRIAPAAAPAAAPAKSHDASTPPPADQDGLLLVDEREASRRLGISPRTLWDLANSGQIKCVKIGRLKRYSVAELAAFVERAQNQTNKV